MAPPQGYTPAPLSIVNAQIALAAAIAYSKLSLGTSIVNADIAAGAAIEGTKLEAGFQKDAASGIAGLNAATELTRIDFMTQKYLSIACAI